MSQRRRPPDQGAASSEPTPDRDARIRAAADEHERFDWYELEVANRGARGGFRSSSRLLRSALATVWRSGRIPLVVSLLLTVLGSAAALVQILILQQLLSKFLAERGHFSIGPVIPLLVAFGLVTALSLGIGQVLAQVQRLLGQLIIRLTSRQILDVTARVPLDAYETPWFFNFVVRVESNSVTKPLELAQALINLLSGITTAIPVAVYLILLEPPLIGLLILTIVPTYFGNRLASRWDFAYAVEQSGAMRQRDYYSFILRLRDTAKEIRAFDLAPALRRRWEGAFEQLISALRVLIRRRIALSSLVSVGTAVMTVGTILFLFWRVQVGDISLAQAGAAILAVRVVTGRLQGATGGANSLFECRLFLQDLEDFVALGSAFGAAGGEAEVTARPTSAERAPAGAALPAFDVLSVDDVSFTYPGATTAALKNVSLQIRGGHVVALVGENGSGKTTLAKLLAGLHQPTLGTLAWDGRASTTVDPRAWRAAVSVVFQDFGRYELSAGENIAIGRALDRPDAPRLRLAAERAGAEFIDALPSGFDTPLSKALPGGADLSLGQWQRIALARAFYRDAPFVILDEPTSAMDPRAERALFDHLTGLLQDKTVLLISHRLSSVTSADVIFVLDQGRIVESGDHDSLMALGGLYHELFTMQAHAYTRVTGSKR